MEPMEDTLEVVRVVEVKPRRRRRKRKQPKTQRQPPYAVVLHNDDVNGFDFVVGALRKVFHYSAPRAYRLTLTAHLVGRTVVWSGMREHAELKAEQLVSCGPDPAMKARGALPLRVSVEPQA